MIQIFILLSQYLLETELNGLFILFAFYMYKNINIYVLLNTYMYKHLFLS